MAVGGHALSCPRRSRRSYDTAHYSRHELQRVDFTRSSGTAEKQRVSCACLPSEGRMIVAGVVLTQCQRVTDGRTDGQTDGQIYDS